VKRVGRDLACILGLALAVRIGAAILIRYPGYMDTAYYSAGAVRIAQGGGLTEPFIWNYLNNPQGLPNPGYLYWMPLSSLLAAPMAALFPGSFLALQLPFAVLSALLPLAAYGISWQATRNRRLAWVSALLMLFSGFYFCYWTLPETFAPFGVLGSLALWMAASLVAEGKTIQAGTSAHRQSLLKFAGVGVLTGLAHLTRADGVLILCAIVAWVVIAHVWGQGGVGPSRPTILDLGGLLGGYVLVMMPWFVRNIGLVGHPLAAGGTKTLWLTNYDDLFCYGCDLSPRAYLQWGWSNILQSKLWALGVNLERFVAEDCLVFLLPFVLLGLYRGRRSRVLMLPAFYLTTLLVVHSFVFTFPGPRGGFFHASAPALPFLFAAGAEGLDHAVRWAAVRRRWKVRQAQGVFGVAAVLGAVMLSGYAAVPKVVQWLTADNPYTQVGLWLDEHDVGQAVVMSGNSPAFWYRTGYQGVAVPNGGVATVLAVADRYGVQYLALSRNHPIALDAFYSGRDGDPRFVPIAIDCEDVRLYALESR